MLTRADDTPSADVIHSPPFRGRVKFLARTIAGTEALESLLDREGEGVLYLSKCGTRAAVAADMADRFLEDMVHDFGIDAAELFLPAYPSASPC